MGGSGRSRRSGIGGLRSFCCWQPFLISFKLGELSRLGGGGERERNRGKGDVDIKCQHKAVMS